MSSPNWPILLSDGELELRPLRLRDRMKWNRVRSHNRDWLREWEATLPTVTTGPSATISPHELPSFSRWFESLIVRPVMAVRTHLLFERQRPDRSDNVGGRDLWSHAGAHIGYWIDRDHANRGFTTQAVEILTRFGFDQLGLHRIEINLRPENAPSRRVAEKAGYILEGSRARYLHIDGQWRDHITL